MQAGESFELETPLPRAIFLVGWSCFLPFLITSTRAGGPPLAYGVIACLGILCGFLVFIPVVVRKFWAFVPVEVAARPEMSSTTRVFLPNSKLTTASTAAPPKSALAAVAPPRKEREEYKHAKATLQRLSPRAAKVRQLERASR